MSTRILKPLPGKFDIKRPSPSILYISASLAMSTSVSKPSLVDLLSKDTHLVFSISQQAFRCQQAFSKPCLVYVISKDTHLVFSISRQALRCQQSFSKACLVNFFCCCFILPVHFVCRGTTPTLQTALVL